MRLLGVRFLIRNLRRLFPARTASALDLTEDRSEWDRASRAAPHRRLNTPLKIEIEGVQYLHTEWGLPISITVSLNPPEFADRVGRESDLCPVCGLTTDGLARLPASLYPTFANGHGIGFGVWVHPSCFETCPDAGRRHLFLGDRAGF